MYRTSSNCSFSKSEDPSPGRVSLFASLSARAVLHTETTPFEEHASHTRGCDVDARMHCTGEEACVCEDRECTSVDAAPMQCASLCESKATAISFPETAPHTSTRPKSTKSRAVTEVP